MTILHDEKQISQVTPSFAEMWRCGFYDCGERCWGHQWSPHSESELEPLRLGKWSTMEFPDAVVQSHTGADLGCTVPESRAPVRTHLSRIFNVTTPSRPPEGHGIDDRSGFHQAIGFCLTALQPCYGTASAGPRRGPASVNLLVVPWSPRSRDDCGGKSKDASDDQEATACFGWLRIRQKLQIPRRRRPDDARVAL